MAILTPTLTCSTPEGDRSGADSIGGWVEVCRGLCSTPEGDRSGADFGECELQDARYTLVLNARRRSKRGGRISSRALVSLRSPVLNARRRSKRGGPCAIVGPEKPQRVLNARRRSKRGGPGGRHQRFRPDHVLNARRRSKRGGRHRRPGAHSGHTGAQRPKAIEAGRTPLSERLPRRYRVLNARRRSKRGGPDQCVDAPISQRLCSTPEGDRSGADSSQASGCEPDTSCSTPEGDRSGADLSDGCVTSC